jgi:hypothetical protein
MIDLKAINLRLGNKRFLSGAAEESFWMHLTAQIEGLRRPGEKLVLPEYNEADAWARAYALYEALQRRAPDPVAVQAEADGRTAAAHSRHLNEFAADRQALLAYRDANRQQWPILSEYVGLLDTDLVEGQRDEHFGVEVGWQDKAQRIGYALRRLQGLSPSERAEVPRKAEEKRRLEILRAHDRDIDNLREALGHILQRLDAIESRLLSPKEVISAMVA